MKRTLFLTATAVVASLILSAPPAVRADSISFVASLKGSLEVPPTGSPATGLAMVVIDTVADTMQVDITFSGLEGGTTASHIHCCLASPLLVGSSVGVATAVPTFTGFPLGVSSGTYSHLFDLTLASSYNPAFVTLEGGSVADAEAALVTGLESGETYLNIHTTPFPGGEVRGFLVAAPEPNSIVLLGTGLLGILCMRRKLGRAI